MSKLTKITKNREELFLVPLSNPATSLFADELEERNITQAEAARSMKVDKQIINALVNKRRDLSADLAMRIEQFLGIRAALLLQIQTDYKLKKAQREKADLIKKEVTPHAV